jgi:prophage regulatory protein
MRVLARVSFQGIEGSPRINMAGLEDERLLTENEILGDKKAGRKGLVPVCKSTWRRGVKSGIYPKPVKVSTKRKAWKAGEIRALLESGTLP